MQLHTRRDSGYMLQVIAEHESIVDALEARDESAAIAALHRHLHTRQYVLADGTRA